MAGGFQRSRADGAVPRHKVCYQEEVRDTSRVAESSEPRHFEIEAFVSAGADQHPARLLDSVIDINLPAIVEFERPAGGANAIAEAAKLPVRARIPVIYVGCRVVYRNAISECVVLAEA